jgi:hypothetical protein
MSGCRARETAVSWITAAQAAGRPRRHLILQVLLADRDEISAIKRFMNPALFPAFDL